LCGEIRHEDGNLVRREREPNQVAAVVQMVADRCARHLWVTLVDGDVLLAEIIGRDHDAIDGWGSAGALRWTLHD
jgi:hypothetical protein